MTRGSPEIGHQLRRYGIDELPQLINVLRGEMSIIGPRPSLPWEVEMYTPEQCQRHACLPGITGLWQVSNRYSLSMLEMLALDVRVRSDPVTEIGLVDPDANSKGYFVRLEHRMNEGELCFEPNTVGVPTPKAAIPPSIIDGLDPTLWQDLAHHASSSLFASRLWVEALVKTYGFDVSASVRDSVRPSPGGLGVFLCR